MSDPASDYLFGVWRDPSTGTSEAKLRRAMARYRETRGEPGALCLVSAADRAAIGPELDGVAVQDRPYIQPHHYYVGVRIAGGENTDHHAKPNREAATDHDAAPEPGGGTIPDVAERAPAPVHAPRLRRSSGAGRDGSGRAAPLPGV